MKRRNFLAALLALPFAARVPNPQGVGDASPSTAIGSVRANAMATRLTEMDDFIQRKVDEHVKRIQNEVALARLRSMVNSAPTGFKEGKSMNQ